MRRCGRRMLRRQGSEQRGDTLTGCLLTRASGTTADHLSYRTFRGTNESDP